MWGQMAKKTVDSFTIKKRKWSEKRKVDIRQSYIGNL